MGRGPTSGQIYSKARSATRRMAKDIDKAFPELGLQWYWQRNVGHAVVKDHTMSVGYRFLQASNGEALLYPVFNITGPRANADLNHAPWMPGGASEKSVFDLVKLV